VSLPTEAVRMQGISKAFGPVQALRGADFTLGTGEVHALLGENGAGKTTLMHVLFGLVAQDAGTVEVFGRALPKGSPRDAMHAGIGLVHQHFSQVPRMTVAENVWLGRPGFRYDRTVAAEAVRQTGQATGLVLDPDAIAGELPVGLRQRLEIVKALAHHARVLLLDEPTASLTPAEITDLFKALDALRRAGIAIVLITHKLREVMEIADRVTVLRRGAVVASGAAGTFTADSLAAAMIGEGREALAPVAPWPAAARNATPVLEARGVTVRAAHRGPPRVRDVSLEVRPGEIVGIAAVEGNGQHELMRAIAGLEPFEGTIAIPGGDVGFIPEDRQREGLILEFSVVENIALAETRGFWLQPRFLEDRAMVAIDEFGIRAHDPGLPARTLSGGNQQKLVLARELSRKPALLVAENPTRGLDLRATADVHEALRSAARTRGLGVLFQSTDLDEVLALADRIGVMWAGTWRWAGESDRSRERLGALMLGATA
jgi:ABC-type uncharacterized transport system ATPase subunit